MSAESGRKSIERDLLTTLPSPDKSEFDVIEAFPLFDRAEDGRWCNVTVSHEPLLAFEESLRFLDKDQ